MDVKFDFEHVGRSNLGEIYRPLAQVSLQSPSASEWIEIFMVVDTGADFTVLPRHFSHDLRISLETDCMEDFTNGVGGERLIYIFKKKIVAKIGNIERHIPIAFFNNDEVPALLGRLGFLETFDTEFLKSHIVIFKQ